MIYSAWFNERNFCSVASGHLRMVVVDDPEAIFRVGTECNLEDVLLLRSPMLVKRG